MKNMVLMWLKKFQSCESEASTLQIHTLLFRAIFGLLFGTLQEKQNLQVPAWFQTGATIISFCFPTSMDEEMDMSSDLSFIAPSDVECSSCTVRKRKAEKTCLQCLASYCEDHLDIHNVLHTNAKRHKMVAATGRLEERVCPEHDKLMEVFCRTDQQCICHLCITNKHRTHDVVSIDHEVAEVKLKLAKIQREITDRIKSREIEMQALKQAIEDFQTSARQAVEENEKSFTELTNTIQLRQGTVKKLILDQEEAAVKNAKELLEQLPSEITDLKKRDFELQRLDQLSEADNGVYFLQGILSTPALPSSPSSPVLFVHPYSSFQLATEAILDLIKQMNQVCNMHFSNISKNVQTADILKSPELKMRDVLLQNASELTLNPDTAHFSLRLSKENREVTAVNQAQDYSSHPDRFVCRAQILCDQLLQGTPQYWEVEFRVSNWVCIAVSYKGIYRKQKRGGLFGRNSCSWGLRCYYTSFEFWHDNKCINVKHNKRCTRIGVYLDHGIGVLEFYNVSDDMSLIYKAHTNFTEPVYAGFGLGGKGSHIMLCDLEKEKAMSK
ncbi:tripartite motif-containing protein 16 isoform X2 [Tachysurus fulvidraco]|uniref:tripartite motif-containing protein 16 isoform X2 n=1 Tax=Tachysurus fulvidraco TaxID=1234273 RepID=UPI000F4F1C18|nr:tripartite motif-containing protein 16 isoform X2 [Tachysurus fulvidraco]